MSWVQLPGPAVMLTAAMRLRKGQCDRGTGAGTCRQELYAKHRSVYGQFLNRQERPVPNPVW